MKFPTRAVAAAAAVSTLILGVCATPAAATPDPTAGTGRALTSAGSGAGAAGTALPTAGDSVTLGDLTIHYPAPAHRASTLNPTTTVFNGDRYDQVVQSTGPQGVRLLTVLAGRHAPRRYTYTFDGHDLLLQDDGSVVVFTGTEPVATIDAAWAVDARGRTVDTHYEVSGDQLVQVVRLTRDTAFPVVADPSVKRRWWGLDIRFSERETQLIATGAAACAIVAGTLPDPTASKVVSALCSTLALYAHTARQYGKCVAVKKPWVGGPVLWLWGC